GLDLRPPPARHGQGAQRRARGDPLLALVPRPRRDGALAVLRRRGAGAVVARRGALRRRAAQPRAVLGVAERRRDVHGARAPRLRVQPLVDAPRGVRRPHAATPRDAGSLGGGVEVSFHTNPRLLAFVPFALFGGLPRLIACRRPTGTTSTSTTPRRSYRRASCSATPGCSGPPPSTSQATA